MEMTPTRSKTNARTPVVRFAEPKNHSIGEDIPSSAVWHPH
jgi:hypothetical protein